MDTHISKDVEVVVKAYLRPTIDVRDLARFYSVEDLLEDPSTTVDDFDDLFVGFLEQYFESRTYHLCDDLGCGDNSKVKVLHLETDPVHLETDPIRLPPITKHSESDIARDPTLAFFVK